MKVPPVKVVVPDVETIKKDVEKIVESGILSSGKYVKEFEEKFAKRHQRKYGVAVGSGTVALEIAIAVLDLPKNNNVTTSTNTFSATIAAIIRNGNIVDLTDVDGHLCMKAEELEGRILPGCVIPVHIGGVICPEIYKIMDLCSDGIPIIEDACHAHGSTLHQSSAGSFGSMACFSFYPTKVMTTGEGGMIVTDEIEYVEKAVMLRDQGKSLIDPNKIEMVGYAGRMTEIGAAIGLRQLEHLSEFIKVRQNVARIYDEELTFENGCKVEVPGTQNCNYYKYTVFVNNRDNVKADLRKRGVHCSGEVYSPPIHQQLAYNWMEKRDFTRINYLHPRMLCLPIYNNMTEEEAMYVVDNLKEVLK